MKAVIDARAEYSKISNELEIQKAIKSKLPTAKQRNLLVGDKVPVLRERYERWKGLFRRQRKCGKRGYVIDGSTSLKCNITEILPHSYDKRNHNLQRLSTGNRIFSQFHTYISPSYSIHHIPGLTKYCKYAVAKEID